MAEISGIVIPSGNKNEDLERAQRAAAYRRQRKINSPYIISGVGPDINTALEISLDSETDKELGLDFHRDLYNYVRKRHPLSENCRFGIDMQSTNSIGNMVNTFPEGAFGTYALVSYPLHLIRFWMIKRAAQRKKKMSRKVEIKYVRTGQSAYQTIYGLAALVKTAWDLRKL